MSRKDSENFPPIPQDNNIDDGTLDAVEFAAALTADHAAFVPTFENGRPKQRGIAHSMVDLTDQDRLLVARLHGEMQRKECGENGLAGDAESDLRSDLTELMEEVVGKGLESLPQRIEQIKVNHPEAAARLQEIVDPLRII